MLWRCKLLDDGEDAAAALLRRWRRVRCRDALCNARGGGAMRMRAVEEEGGGGVYEYEQHDDDFRFYYRKTVYKSKARGSLEPPSRFRSCERDCVVTVTTDDTTAAAAAV